MKKITGNENAYPFAEPANEKELGLTIRQHYAGLAMQGYLSASQVQVSNGMIDCNEVANYAVNFADALIQALNTNQTTP